MKSMYISWAVKGGIVMICWGWLAMYFNHWWIALFALLFMPSIKTVAGSFLYCDACGRHSPHAANSGEAIEKARKAGWMRRKAGDKWEDYCPECQAKGIGADHC